MGDREKMFHLEDLTAEFITSIKKYDDDCLILCMLLEASK